MAQTLPPAPGRAATRRRGRAAAAAALVLAAACGAQVDPTEDLTTGEAILGLSDAIAGMREETAVLQDQLDSLRAVVARQDSTIARLAAVTGVPLPAR
jgi:hypothetical protein